MVENSYSRSARMGRKKSQIPKSQIPNKSQITNPKIPKQTSVRSADAAQPRLLRLSSISLRSEGYLGFEIFLGFGILGFGILNL